MALFNVLYSSSSTVCAYAHTHTQIMHSANDGAYKTTRLDESALARIIHRYIYVGKTALLHQGIKQYIHQTNIHKYRATEDPLLQFGHTSGQCYPLSVVNGGRAAALSVLHHL